MTLGSSNDLGFAPMTWGRSYDKWINSKAVKYYTELAYLLS